MGDWHEWMLSTFYAEAEEEKTAFQEWLLILELHPLVLGACVLVLAVMVTIVLYRYFHGPFYQHVSHKDFLTKTGGEPTHSSHYHVCCKKPHHYRTKELLCARQFQHDLKCARAVSSLTFTFSPGSKVKEKPDMKKCPVLKISSCNESHVYGKSSPSCDTASNFASSNSYGSYTDKEELNSVREDRHSASRLAAIDADLLNHPKRQEKSVIGCKDKQPNEPRQYPSRTDHASTIRADGCNDKLTYRKLPENVTIKHDYLVGQSLVCTIHQVRYCEPPEDLFFLEEPNEDENFEPCMKTHNMSPGYTLAPSVGPDISWPFGELQGVKNSATEQSKHGENPGDVDPHSPSQTHTGLETRVSSTSARLVVILPTNTPIDSQSKQTLTWGSFSPCYESKPYKPDQIVGIKRKRGIHDCVCQDGPCSDHHPVEPAPQQPLATVKIRRPRSRRRAWKTSRYGWSANARHHRPKSTPFKSRHAVAAFTLGRDVGAVQQEDENDQSRVMFSPMPSPCKAVVSIPTKTELKRHSSDTGTLSQKRSDSATIQEPKDLDRICKDGGPKRQRKFRKYITSGKRVANRGDETVRIAASSVSAGPGSPRVLKKKRRFTSKRYHAYFESDTSSESHASFFRKPLREREKRRPPKRYSRRSSKKNCLNADSGKNMKCIVSLSETTGKPVIAETKRICNQTKQALENVKSEDTFNTTLKMEDTTLLAQELRSEQGEEQTPHSPRGDSLPRRPKPLTPHQSRSTILFCPGHQPDSQSTRAWSENPGKIWEEGEPDSSLEDTGDSHFVLDNLEAPVVCSLRGEVSNKGPSPPTVSLDSHELVYLYKLAVKKVGVGFRLSPVDLRAGYAGDSPLGCNKTVQPPPFVGSPKNLNLGMQHCAHQKRGSDIAKKGFNQQPKHLLLHTGGDERKILSQNNKMKPRKQTSKTELFDKNKDVPTADICFAPKALDLGRFGGESLFGLSSPPPRSGILNLHPRRTCNFGRQTRPPFLISSPKRDSRDKSPRDRDENPVGKQNHTQLAGSPEDSVVNYYYTPTSPGKKCNIKRSKRKQLKKTVTPTDQFANSHFDSHDKESSGRAFRNIHMRKEYCSYQKATDNEQRNQIPSKVFRCVKNRGKAISSDANNKQVKTGKARANQSLQDKQKVVKNENEIAGVDTLRRLENVVQKLTNVLKDSSPKRKAKIKDNSVNNLNPPQRTKPNETLKHFARCNTSSVTPRVLVPNRPRRMSKFPGMASPANPRQNHALWNTLPPAKTQGKAVNKVSPAKTQGKDVIAPVTEGDHEDLAEPPKKTRKSAPSPKNLSTRDRGTQNMFVCSRGSGPPWLRTAARAAAKSQVVQQSEALNNVKAKRKVRAGGLKTNTVRRGHRRLYARNLEEFTRHYSESSTSHLPERDADTATWLASSQRIFMTRKPTSSTPHAFSPNHFTEPPAVFYIAAPRKSPKRDRKEMADLGQVVKLQGCRFAAIQQNYSPGKKKPEGKYSCSQGRQSSLSCPFSIDTSWDVSAAQVFD